MEKPELPQPRKRPKQSRSLILFQAIREACLKILREEGPEQLTTQRIADVAGINIASLYQYFPNKEAVLAEVFNEQIRRHTELAREHFEDIYQLSRTDFEGTLRAIVRIEIEQHRMLHGMAPEFYRAYLRSLDIHGEMDEVTIALDNPSWDEWIPQFLRSHRDRLRSGDVDILARMVTHVLTGVLVSAVTNEPELLEQPAFEQELNELLLRYLCK